MATWPTAIELLGRARIIQLPAIGVSYAVRPLSGIATLAGRAGEQRKMDTPWSATTGTMTTEALNS